MQEKLPLSGKKIIVTRPKSQSENFLLRLTNLGAEIINFPTIEIKSLENSNLDSAFEKLNTYDWIIFTSVNAVEIFFKRFFEKKFDLRSLYTNKFAVVGSKTLKTLYNYGIKADLIPDEYLAEAVLAEFAKTDIKEKHFLIPGAALAREILVEGLTELGAIVDNIPIYDTVIPDAFEVKEIVERLINENIDYITFTSSSTVTNFFELLKNNQIEKLINKAKIVCIGPVTAETVNEKLGFKPLIAEVYTTDGIIETIIKDIKKSVF